MSRPSVQRAFPVLVALLLFVAPAAADDEPAEKAKPLSPQQAAHKVLEAVKAKDDAALKSLARQGDLWLVADELCFRGEHDAALALAKESTRPDFARLPDYVEAWRKREPDEAERKLLDAMNAAMMARTPEKVLAGAASLPVEIDTVVRVRLRHSHGMAFKLLRRWNEGRAALEQAGDAAVALGWLIRAQMVYDYAGQCARLGSDLPGTVAVWTKQLDVIARRQDPYSEAAALLRLADLHAALGEAAKALALRESALPALEKIGDNRRAAGVRNTIGIAYFRRGEHAKALPFYESALAWLEGSGDVRALAETLVNAAHVHSARSEYPRALAMYERALGLAKSVQHKPTIANAKGGMGIVYSGQGEHRKAIEIQEQVLALWHALGDAPGIARTRGNLARGLVSAGEFTKALAIFEEALATRERLGDKSGAITMRSEIGDVHRRLGDYPKALSIFERVRGEASALGHRALLARALSDLGITRLLLGEHASALARIEQALAAFQALGRRHAVATALTNIGAAYNSIGNHKKALAYYERAGRVYETLGDKTGLAGGLVNVGNIHLALGNHAEAVAFYERGLDLAMEIGFRPWVLNALANMGSAYRELGDLANALAFYERALVEANAMGAEDRSAGIHLGIGIVRARRGETREARKLLEKAARAAHSLRATALYVMAKTELARLYLEMDRSGSALGAAREALTAAEKMVGGFGEEEGASARAQLTELYELGALAAAREDDAAYLLMFLDSGRAGALLDALGKRDVLRWKAESLPPALRRLDLEAQAAERSARMTYDAAVKRGDLKETRGARDALDAAKERLSDVAGRIQRELKQQAGLFYPRAATIEAVQERLAQDEALVLYALCRDETLALVLRSDDERIVALGSASAVEDACETLDATTAETDPDEALTALRRLLVEPLKLEADVKALLVSPEGPLCYLPFGALFDRPVAMTPSGTTHDLLMAEERGSGTGILALGDPDYAGVSDGAKSIYYRGRTLAALPQTRKEAETIGTTTLLGSKASEDDLGTMLATSKRWRAVHLACHGLVDIDRPMQSSLALSRAGERDGFLTAREILRMKIPADLVVLSACETAKGKIVKGEGIVGLTRAFMFAGSPRVICSLWKVDDEATQALMIKFYELWNGEAALSEHSESKGPRGKGLDAAEALEKAQEHIKAQEKWKHPYYWAAWVLWGLPD